MKRIEKIIESYTQHELEKMISIYPNLVQYIPNKLLNDKMMITSLKKKYNIKYIKHLIDENKVKDIVQCGIYLTSIPKDLITKELVIMSLKYNENAALYIPDEYMRDEDIIIYCLKSNQSNSVLSIIDYNLLSYNNLLYCTTINNQFIKFLPKQLFNEDIVKEIIKKDGYNIKYIPKNFITYDLCINAVKNGAFYQDIPSEFLDENMYYNIYKYSKSFAPDLENVNIPLTKRICFAYSMYKYCNIYNIPKEYLTDDFYRLILKNNYRLFSKIYQLNPDIITPNDFIEIFKECNDIINDAKFDKRLITYDNAKIILKTNGYYIKYIPYSLLNEELIIDAINSNSYAVNYIPKSLITDDIALIMAQKINYMNYDIEDIIPKNLISFEVALTLVKHGARLKDIPKKYLNEKLYKSSIKVNGTNIKFIPEEFIDKNMIIESLNYGLNHIVIHYIPEDLLYDRDIINAIINNESDNILKIPSEMLTYNDYKKAILNCNNLSLIDNIPEEYLDEEMYLTFIKNSHESIWYIKNPSDTILKKYLELYPYKIKSIIDNYI